MGRRVKLDTLRMLMRHASIETTLRDYADQQADDIADQLGATYARNAVGNTTYRAV